MALLDRDTATIDDVRAAVPVPPGVNPKAFGAVPGPLAERRIIKAARYVKTGRAVGNKRPVTLWKLADRSAAAARLAAHPGLPDPAGPEGVGNG